MHHLIAFIDNFFVGETNHFYTVLIDYLFPKLLVILLSFMNAAVDFDHQTYLVAVKVCNETMNDLLPLKVQSADLIFTNHIPETFFCQSHLLAEIFGK